MTERAVTVTEAAARELLGTIEVSIRTYGSAAAKILLPIQCDIEAQLAALPPKPTEP